MTDLTYLIGVSGYTFGVVVRSDSPWKTWEAMVAFAKANPGKLTYGTPGANTAPFTMEESRIATASTGRMSRSRATRTTCRRCSGGTSTPRRRRPGWAPHVEAGKMRLLATWGAQRTRRWGSVPTLKELGYDVVSTSPYGIAGPKGMDPQWQSLHDAFKKGMEDARHWR